VQVKQLVDVISQARIKICKFGLGSPEADAAREQIRVLNDKCKAIIDRGSHTQVHADLVDRAVTVIKAQPWVVISPPPAVEPEKKEWYHKRDLVKEVLESLPMQMSCPKCWTIKPKADFGVRVTRRSPDGFPTRAQKQSYCRPCRSKK
jgi:hypothetical protein